MSLHKIKDFEDHSSQSSTDDDILGFSLYSNQEKIGSVDDILVDDDGQLRYFVINTGVWVFGKKVLLPIGRARVDFADRRVYANTLTKEQVESLPEYDKDMTVGYDQEEAVRKVYRSGAAKTQPVSNPAAFGVGYGGADTAPPSRARTGEIDLSAGYAGYDHSDYTYDRDPDLYNLTDEHHADLKRYQERLKANRARRVM
ncbi:hypothetical protein C7H19_07610 [Aphanothece hegewaldii CCALA 016]|uniref:PRC-barrel domain-containing protein n=1 Tax=Aphanothece hegewaldii CCALA 016 TaxID=2107694 RepID=A0A2T1LZM0_9CHRO|nr:PRC-barrel domain-containing protein [Aphanothece hegewaldii]PSF37842.1 hypothetical protein C7H19_07610 [Aphanothece hegewaldii CCALA 016]